MQTNTAVNLLRINFLSHNQLEEDLWLIELEFKVEEFCAQCQRSIRNVDMTILRSESLDAICPR
jgi:hypothetical protein